jgi:hypothetical protein
VFSDRVDISWAVVPGMTEYQLYRAASKNDEEAAPISGWISDTTFSDYTASSAEHVPGLGCFGAHDDFQHYSYWVKARNPGGESVLSAPDEGWRGL